VDGVRKSAIARFKDIHTAEEVFKFTRTLDEVSGERVKLLGDSQPSA
jgi:hypothetical protein